MSLREDIWEHLPETVTNVVVDRGDVYGLDAIKVTVYYRSPADKPMFMTLHFAKKNQMTGEHIGAVVRSYIHNSQKVV